MTRTLLAALLIGALVLTAGCVTAKSAGHNTEAEKHLLAATERQKAHDTAGALVELNQAVALDPNSPHPLIRRGTLRADLKDYDGAFADFDKAVALAPDNAAAWFGRGVLRLQRKDVTGALSDLNRAVALAPKQPEMYLKRGEALAASGDFEAAIRDFTLVADTDPRQDRAFLWRAYAYCALGKKDLALIDLQYVREHARDPVLTQLAKDRMRDLQLSGQPSGSSKIPPPAPPLRDGLGPMPAPEK